MTPKILKIVDACNGCTHCQYCTSGQSECQLVEEIIPDKKQIASFCPLSDYPSRIIADMDATIRALREPNKYALVHAILSHVATKLKTTVGTNDVVTITLKNSVTLFLWHDLFHHRPADRRHLLPLRRQEVQASPRCSTSATL